MMIIRKSPILLLAALVVLLIGSVIVVPDVIAGPYDSCRAVSISRNGTIIPSAYTINVNNDGGPWPFASTCPDQGRGTECYGYTYDFLDGVSPVTGVAQSFALIPVGAPGSLYIWRNHTITSVNQVFDPGQGADTVPGFGFGEFHAFIARTPPVGGLPNLRIFTNQSAVAVTTIAFKVGNTNYYCGPIRGAAGVSNGFAQGAVISSSVVTTEDGAQWCLAADPSTQCDVVVDCATGTIVAPSIPITEFSFGQTSATEQIVFSASPGQPCPRFYVKNRGANTDYMCIAGRCYPCPPYPCR